MGVLQQTNKTNLKHFQNTTLIFQPSAAIQSPERHLQPELALPNINPSINTVITRTSLTQSYQLHLRLTCSCRVCCGTSRVRTACVCIRPCRPCM